MRARRLQLYCSSTAQLLRLQLDEMVKWACKFCGRVGEFQSSKAGECAAANAWRGCCLCQQERGWAGFEKLGCSNCKGAQAQQVWKPPPFPTFFSSFCTKSDGKGAR